MHTLIFNKKETRKFIQRCFHHESIFSPVLEIGSGRDRFNRELFSRRYKVIASNIYPKNVVDYICSVNCLPFEDGKLGCVICEHVLEHVEEPAKAIEEINRVLRPGGLLILIVPFSWPLHEKPYDLWRFSEEGLRALLMKRFEQVKFETIGKPDKTNLICVTARKPVHKKQEKKAPRVSVIMPTYNRARMIGKSIDSVLNQTFTDWELIVISDGSTDNTRQVVRRYKDPRIIFLEKKNAGPASARNYGLRHARGEYIAYCDDDDEIFPYHLQTQVNYLDRHPEKGFIRGDAVQFLCHKKEGYRKTGLLWTLVHKRSALKKVGFFDENLRMWQDFDFVLRLRDYYDEKTLEYILAKHWIHPESLVIMQRAKRPGYLDRVYVKRVRKVFKSPEIKKAFFVLAANIFYRQNCLKTPLALAKIFYSRYPDIESAYLLGLSYFKAANTSKAIEFMRKVVSYKTKPNKKKSMHGVKIREFAHVLLATHYLHKRKYNLSMRYLCRGLKLNQRSLLLRLELFHAYLESGRIDLARGILKRTGNKTALSYMKGVISLSQKDYRKAQENFKKASDIDKSLRYRLYSSLGKLYSETDRKGQAERYYTESLKLNRETYFSILLNRELLRVDLEQMRELMSRVLLYSMSRELRII